MLSAGAELGPYEIVALVGAGGMGEVYRARDTKLNRDVAIKVLLPAVANDPDRLARFSREAQVLASLNHPNIAASTALCAGQITEPVSEFQLRVIDIDIAEVGFTLEFSNYKHCVEKWGKPIMQLARAPECRLKMGLP